MSKKFNFIYQTTNLVNGKIYVGKHSTNKIDDGYIGCGIYRQSGAHFFDNPFCRAVLKHNYVNFKRDILEFCNDYTLLNDREIYWIELLDSTNDQVGYNLTIGGSGGDTISRQNLLICTYCGLQTRSYSNMSRYHNDNCKQNPNYIPKIKIRPILTCPHCGAQGKNKGNMMRNHFDRCKQSPLYVPRLMEQVICPHCGQNGGKSGMIHNHFDNCPRVKEQNKLQCPHCNKIGGSGGMQKWHFDNCKLKMA